MTVSVIAFIIVIYRVFDLYIDTVSLEPALDNNAVSSVNAEKSVSLAAVGITREVTEAKSPEQYQIIEADGIVFLVDGKTVVGVKNSQSAPLATAE